MLILIFFGYHQNFTHIIGLDLIKLSESSKFKVVLLKSFLDCESINTISYSENHKFLFKEPT